MIEPDIVVDKRGPLELLVLFNRKECNWIFEDRGIEVVGPIEGKVIQTDGNGSHVQEGFGRRPKKEGLIYPGNNSKQVKPNLNNGGLRNCRHKKAGCGEEKATVEERSMLRCSS